MRQRTRAPPFLGCAKLCVSFNLKDARVIGDAEQERHAVQEVHRRFGTRLRQEPSSTGSTRRHREAAPCVCCVRLGGRSLYDTFKFVIPPLPQGAHTIHLSVYDLSPGIHHEPEERTDLLSLISRNIMVHSIVNKNHLLTMAGDEDNKLPPSRITTFLITTFRCLITT